ncbi:MAG: phosphomannomutase [Nitrococcus mobilis]|nr:phosphomannomutase [Nitrococcus mobilis]
MTKRLECFKAYDIRGRVPHQLNADIAYRIGRAYAEWLQPRDVVVGYDVRLTSPQMSQALGAGLLDGGANVHDIGLCGTEEVYFATAHFGMDGGIMVTASHNPVDFNGMKLLREQARPISGDTGLFDVHDRAVAASWREVSRPGTRRPLQHRPAYLEHLLGFVDRAALKPLRIVVNAGNGGAGPVLDALAERLPFEFVRVHHEPDGSFPNGVPNPLLLENRRETEQRVLESGADLGIAWDGDFDRCFLFDERGHFIEGYYIVGLLAEAFLRRHPGEKIIHDPRLIWNTIDIASGLGGIPVQSKTGHAFIKERMRLENAIYGGEMSAHHYFRDFSYCDSGMLPWLLVAERVSLSGKPLSELVSERLERFPVSGEINRRLKDPDRALAGLEAHYRSIAESVDHIDGLSMTFERWRFNLRSSNTEPMVRLNVEARGDRALMEHKTAEILHWLEAHIGLEAD